MRPPTVPHTTHVQINLQLVSVVSKIVYLPALIFFVYTHKHYHFCQLMDLELHPLSRKNKPHPGQCLEEDRPRTLCASKSPVVERRREGYRHCCTHYCCRSAEDWACVSHWSRTRSSFARLQGGKREELSHRSPWRSERGIFSRARSHGDETALLLGPSPFTCFDANAVSLPGGKLQL